jgi:hypothetical protein
MSGFRLGGEAASLQEPRAAEIRFRHAETEACIIPKICPMIASGLWEAAQLALMVWAKW